MKINRTASSFDLLHSASLLSQKERIRKFKKVIARIVKPDSIVIDIGTGTGILAFLAAEAGAREVIGLDVNEESIHYARMIAKSNALDQRIGFVHSSYDEFIPDERADLVICEMLSSAMLIEQQIPAMQYAVRNFLSKKGKILPNLIKVYVVPISCETLWKRFSFEGLEFMPLPQTLSKYEGEDFADMQLCIDYDPFKEKDTLVWSRALEFRMLNGGFVHGLSGVFEAKLDDDVSLSMADGWREILLPFPKPIRVDESDILCVEISYEPGNYKSLKLIGRVK